MTAQTLTEALAEIGIRHTPSAIDGKRDLFREDGKHLGAYDAAEGWAFVAVLRNTEAA